nr:MAG TPA: hypothetical protein [Caudoviricetes sp.]
MNFIGANTSRGKLPMPLSLLAEKRNKPIVLHFGLFRCLSEAGNSPIAIKRLRISQKGGVST